MAACCEQLQREMKILRSNRPDVERVLAWLEDPEDDRPAEEVFVGGPERDLAQIMTRREAAARRDAIDLAERLVLEDRPFSNREDVSRWLGRLKKETS